MAPEQRTKKYFDSIIKRDGRTVRFDREKITNAIFAAAQAVGGKDKWVAEEVTDKVVQELKEKFGAKSPTVEQVQDIVERALIHEGYADTAKTYILYREQRRQLRDLKSFFEKSESIIEGYLGGADWRVRENANEAYSMTGLQAHISGNVVAEYTLNKIYPKEVSEAHRNAGIHIHDLSHGVFAAYSFYRNETVIVREKDSEKAQNLSFEQLFEEIDSEMIEENGFQIKYPLSELEVWDENGWTKLERVLRHKTGRKLLSLNTSNGKNVILTEDHPFITLAGKKQPAKCPICNSLRIVKNRTNKIGKDYFKCKDCGKRFSKPVEKALNIEEREIITAGELSLNNIAISPQNILEIKQASTIKPKDAWFVGFFAAEGYFKQKHLMFDLKKGSKDSLKLINYLKNNCFAHAINYRVKNNEESLNSQTTSQIAFDTVVIGILQESLSESLQEMFKTMRAGAENKNLPINFLNQANEVIGAMVSGLVDGDGVVRNDDQWVSRVNVRVVSKTMLSQVQNWLAKEKMPSSLSTIDSFGNREFKGKIISPKKQLYSLSFYIPDAKKSFFKECIKIDENFKFSKIEKEGKNCASFRKIEEVKNDSEFVYDITTSTHSFVCSGVLVHNCAGWSLRQLLTLGFAGVPGRIAAKPAGHMHAAVGQLVNFFGTLQNEWAGAQAVSSFDTYMAPFVWKEGLSFEEVKQGLQEFVYSINQISRWGNQPPFTNITLDWTVPEDLKNQPAIIKGKPIDKTYGDFQEEMDLINSAFLEMMIKGDAEGRTFSFPIPTYNITRDFNWDSENAEALFEMTAKYGTPYFQNFINSSLKPKDVRSMCCRLRLDLTELRSKTGGLFGAGELTGSIGVVTVNMPKIGFLSRKEGEGDFFARLEQLMILAKDSLEIKRKEVQKNMDQGLLPYTKRYLGNLDNHFATIGLLGMHEACLNFLGPDFGIQTNEGKNFSLKVLDFMREKLQEFQTETGHMYNLEATPGEGTSYRFAKHDKKNHSGIIHSGKDTPFYTNSSQLPVDYTEDIFEALDHQDELQCKYTGGTVLHGFLGERISSSEACKKLVKKIASNYKLPYFTITPTFSVCKKHGYIAGRHEKCPAVVRNSMQKLSVEATAGI